MKDQWMWLALGAAAVYFYTQKQKAAATATANPITNITNMLANMTSTELTALASQVQAQGLPATTSGSSQVSGLG